MWQISGIIAYILNLNHYHTMIPFVNLCTKFNCNLLWDIHVFDSWLRCSSDHLCKSLNIKKSVATLYQMVHVWINELLKSHIWWAIGNHVLLMKKMSHWSAKLGNWGLNCALDQKLWTPNLSPNLKLEMVFCT